MSMALLFPGQGSQTPGFLHRLPDIPAVRSTFERASDFLGYDILMLDSDTTLASTISTQLGLVIAGAAFWNFLAAERIEPRAVAGMSVGTFSAAIACGSITLEVALKSVQRRAELMQSAFQERTGGMMAVQGLGLVQIESILRGTEYTIANFNSQTQFVIAGPLNMLGSLVDSAMVAGASKATILANSVPSHIHELAPASQELLTLVRRLAVLAPNKPMFSNRHARPIATVEGVREELALNMANPVRWHDIMSALGGLGVTLVLEAPPGHTLAPLASETIPGVRALPAAETRWDVLLLAAQLEQHS
jgi:malonate decarboxylase epsilon subunit